jgi:hypothetical protein
MFTEASDLAAENASDFFCLSTTCAFPSASAPLRVSVVKNRYRTPIGS